MALYGTQAITMPLTEIEAGWLTPAELDHRGHPLIVIRCWDCGYLVRTHESDACPCSGVTVRHIGEEVTVQTAQDPPPEVWRLNCDVRAH